MRIVIAVVGLAVLSGCNASTMAGFAEAMKEDRIRREQPNAYPAYLAGREQKESERELEEMRSQLDDMRSAQRSMCRDTGGILIGSSCI